MSYYLIHWLLASLCLMITAYVVPGFRIENFVAALLAAIIVGLVNVFVWPVLVLLTLPLTVLSFGLFLFVVNGLALKVAAALTPGFTIVGFMPAIIGSVVLTLVAWAVRFLFGMPNHY
jgi:putative membrane protein